MATPVFVPSPSTSGALGTPIRFYTALDPYHYTVDNRPLSDIESNFFSIGTQGVDAARRAGLMAQMSYGEFLKDRLKIGPSGTYAEGFNVDFNTGTLTISEGSLFIEDSLYTGSSLRTVKQAILPAPSQFTVAAAATGGNSIDYLIQVKFDYPTVSVSSPNPYFDSTNNYLPSSLLVGNVLISMKTGTQAATGSQVTPSPDAGYIGLYAVTFANGQSAPNVIKMASGAPTIRSSKIPIRFVDNVFGFGPGASSTNLNGAVLPLFVNGSTTGISFSISMAEADINPYLPLKLKITSSGSASGGNVRWQLDSSKVIAGTAIISPTTLGSVSAAVSGTTNLPTRYTDAGAALAAPTDYFSGYVSNRWSVTPDVLMFRLSRFGADGADTHTGDITVYNIDVFQ